MSLVPRQLARLAARALVALAAVAALRCVTPDRAPEPARLSRATIQALDRAVFEVVVPKRDEPQISYAGGRELPVKELPYQERIDRYYSIGTAFAIAPGKLVSAAHVLQLDRFAPRHELLVRDRQGRVYEIARIVRYSQYRDLVEFTLDKPPPAQRVKPLPTSQRSEVGDTVYTVGNANGEGIAVRDGQIASFTFEPINGVWKDIRFSAPASPGNSGGPLLNTRGEVIGIVVRKNQNENLNVAIPIAELARLSFKQAEFFVPSLEANRDGERLRDWRFEAPVPAPLKRLARQAEANRRQFHLRQWAAFVKARRDVSFPRDPALREFVWEQTYEQNVQFLSYAEKTGYVLAPKKPVSDARTTTGETVYTMVDEPDHSLVQIEVARGASTADYLRRPERLLDAIIETFGIYREFNGRRIPLRSLGPPASTGSFVDVLGRPWLKAVWRTHFNQGTFLLNCLPGPRSFGCALDLMETGDETFAGQEKFERLHAGEVAMSYAGDVRSWRQFLALGARWVPKPLQALRFGAGPQGTVALAADGLRVAYSQPLYNDSSWLFVGLGYGLQSTLSQEVRRVRLEHGPQRLVTEEFDVVVDPPRVLKPQEKDRVYRVLGVRSQAKGGRRVLQLVSCSGATSEATCNGIAASYRAASR